MFSSERAGPVIVTAGAAMALVGSFLPWIRSGARGRSSYEIVDLLERLGFTPDGLVGWAFRVWPLVPLLLVSSVVVQWWGAGSRDRLWRSVRSLLPLASVVYAGASAAAVRWAADTGPLQVAIGPTVTMLGCGVAAGGALASLSRRGSGAQAAS